MTRIQKGAKRSFDIFGSLAAIIIFSPILLVTYFLIKIDSRGPSFFKQTRIGADGEPFEILKFRTMIVDAEYVGHGISIKSDDDERVTKIGKILRKASIDELPQLFNVLSGTMSLVGPRPPVTYTPYDGYQNYPSWAQKRFEFKPGITGLAQITVRNSVSWDERMKIDIKYIEEYSLLNDFRILLGTLKRVTQSKNIY